MSVFKIIIFCTNFLKIFLLSLFFIFFSVILLIYGSNRVLLKQPLGSASDINLIFPTSSSNKSISF